MQTRHQKLYQVLQDLRPAMQGCLAVTRLFHEFVMMSLHVNGDVVMRFAGKCGEAEAHAAYVELQPWSSTRDARAAIMHAGQTIFAARAVPPYQLRGVDSTILHHTIMVLWTYGMMQRDAARRMEATAPFMKSRASVALEEARALQPPDDRIVFLDQTMGPEQKAFVAMNSGLPCIHMNGYRRPLQGPLGEEVEAAVCDLRNPHHVMKMGINVLESNYPNTVPDDNRSNLPQLIKCLCNLMDELGSLR
jgi:hypothetical protein